ncbi:helix-turn-helix domain-containing protein [Pedobacter hiemivivus]|uniref:Helix-turn-helix domain-containing protein n=1 Tax=Pedobacter hiemivivus TaxID=2530454 RepID=A0A4U1G0X5_9SPHI|nr:helix-turn-helix domain-containing protein [Pedobacter hiemivivus]TKC57135.1 helix-turn-helix domain-containing protein [Pedobacter hiemivivus]
MKHAHTDRRTGGIIHFLQNEPFYGRLSDQSDERLFTIALNSGPDQEVYIDNITYTFPSWSLLPLFSNQSFSFEAPEQVSAWQYNRDFYCIVDHDNEVSCAGFLFFGSYGQLFIHLDQNNRKMLQRLSSDFVEEFQTQDSTQSEMLKTLLKRLIIIATRLAKAQYLKTQSPSADHFLIIRKYNLLVDRNYKTQHQVQFYANELNKSPKTLSNLFARHHHKLPLQIIHDRIMDQAKRLLFYTDKSVKEIAYELGFEDAAHFSRFFKNITGQNITQYKTVGHHLPPIHQ